MESANRSEVVSQRFAVAPFESLTQLLDCCTNDLLGLLDFHDCSPVSGASCPLHQTPRGQGPETENGSEESSLKAAKRGERDKSSARSESSESGCEHGIAVNYWKDSKTSRSIAVYFSRS
jgi:hypothetical protein